MSKISQLCSVDGNKLSFGCNSPPLQKSLKFDLFEQADLAQLERCKQFSAPLLDGYAPVGLDLPTQDHEEATMDLNELCIQHPSATYYIRAFGESMSDEGIRDQDILVVDRSLQAIDGNIVVAALNGDFIVRLLDTSSGIRLVPRNQEFSEIEISDADDFEIFGVVTYVVHSTLS